jgi:hypothetical protein
MANHFWTGRFFFCYDTSQNINKKSCGCGVDLKTERKIYRQRRSH